MKTSFLLVAALAVGLGIALVDASPGWDDTGVSAAAILAASGLFGLLHPRRAWLWGLAVGAWVPGLGLLTLHGSYASLLALLFSFAGAYTGAFARDLASRTVA